MGLNDVAFKKLRLWVTYPFAAVYLFWAYTCGIEFKTGIGFIFVGLLVRFWAAGYIKKKRELATGGPYAFVRNPLYLGNFLMGLGFCLFVQEILTTLLYFVLFFIFYWGTIREEEVLLTELFGQKYLDYKKSVPVLFPLSKVYKSGQTDSYSIPQAHRNGEFIRIMVTVLLVFTLYSARGIIQHTIPTELIKYYGVGFIVLAGLLWGIIQHRIQYSKK